MCVRKSKYHRCYKVYSKPEIQAKLLRTFGLNDLGPNLSISRLLVITSHVFGRSTANSTCFSLFNEATVIILNDSL